MSGEQIQNWLWYGDDAPDGGHGYDDEIVAESYCWQIEDQEDWDI